MTTILTTSPRRRFLTHAVARLEFPFRRTLFALMLLTIMLPHQVTLIPQYVIFDGLGWVNTYLSLARPALVTTAIFTFIWTYDDFLGQLVYLSDIDLFTVPLGLRLFLDASGEFEWGPMFAMSVLALIPTFGFFLAFQRLLIDGISTTGIK